MVFDLVGIIATTTFPTIAKYLATRLNKWIQTKIGSDSESSNIQNLTDKINGLKAKVESTNYSATEVDVKELTQTVKEVNNIQQKRATNLISTNDFREWTLKGLKEGYLDSEEVVTTIVYQLELIDSKLRESSTTREKIYQVQDMIVALKTNLQFYLDQEREARLSGLQKDKENAMSRRIVLQKSLEEARNIIGKYE
jgi:hypothetical protein